MKTPTSLLAILFTSLIFSLNTIAQNVNSQCLYGYVICSNNPIAYNYFENITGVVEFEPQCLPDKNVKNAVTFFWSAKSTVSLGFDIIPNSPDDDLDFVLYKIDPSNLECQNWEVKRCMGVGPNLIDSSLWDHCVGLTGLSNLGRGENQPYGCKINSNNYLTSLEVEASELFALKITNFSSFEGFTLIFNNAVQFNPPSTLPFATTALESEDHQFINVIGCIEKTGLILTDIDATSNHTSIELFPNPSKNEVILKTRDIEITTANIYSSEGKLISQKSTTGSTEVKFNTSGFQNGLYFIEFVDIKGKSYTRSFVKL